MVSCSAHCPCSSSLPIYSSQICICLSFTDVDITGLAFLVIPSYLHATLLLTSCYVYVRAITHSRSMDYFRLATGRRKSSPPRGALADISCCLLLSAYR
jgi:hypothetical protein